MACDVALGQEFETKRDKYMDKAQVCFGTSVAVETLRNLDRVCAAGDTVHTRAG